MKHATLKILSITIIDISVALLSMSFPDYVLSGLAAAIFSYAQLALSFFIIAALLLGKFGKLTKIHLLIFFIYLIPLLSTIISGEPKIITGIKTLLMNFSLYSYISHRLNSKTKDLFYKNTLRVWLPLVLFNTATLIFCYRNKFSGINDFYFLGNDNGTIFESFLLIEYAIIYSFAKNSLSKKIPLILTVIILIGYLRTMSGNAMVACMLILTILLIHNIPAIKKILKPIYVSAIYVIFFLLIVVGRGDSGITGSILNALGKDNTYTGRTVIWDSMIEHTENKPLLGNGYETPEMQVRKYGHIKAHNLFIQTYYDGGFLELSCLIILLALTLLGTRDLRARDASIIAGLLLIYLIICTFDYYNYKYHLIMTISPILTGFKPLRKDIEQ